MENKTKLDIIFHVGGLPFDGKTLKEEGLGGSETAGYYMAEKLSKRGHTVRVFTKDERQRTSSNVSYFYCGEISEEYPLGEIFHKTAYAPHDVCIIQRHRQAFLDDWINAKVKIWWLHDIAVIRAKDDRHFMNIDEVFTVSDWHKKQVHETYNIPLDSIYVTKNGVDYSIFDKIKDTPYKEREKNSLIFASRPERGLENLVKVGGIMEKLPEHKLYVCSYENVTAQMKPYYDELYHRCNILPNVEILGHLSKKELNKKMSKCMLVVHPTTFEDTSNMLSLEANACGTPFVGFQTGALPETMKDAGATLLRLRKDDEIDEPFLTVTIENICNDDRIWNALHKKALAKKQAWDDIAFDWEKRIFKIFEGKNSQTAFIKHMIHNSDIIPLINTTHLEDILNVDPKFQNKYGFVFDGDYKKHYQRFYEYEKSRGIEYEAEDISSCNRFKACLNMVYRMSQDRDQPISILDYGCAHGHYAMNLEKYLPENTIKKYIGIDISSENIKAAKKWKNVSYPDKDISFFEAEYDDLPPIPKVDILIMGEVLEHVPNPTEIINTLKKHVNPGGMVIITTPYGAWEAIGYNDNPDWCRAHIWHFEKQDIIEMLGTQDNLKVFTIPHPADNLYGHYLATFQPNQKDVVVHDINKKRYNQDPQETLSVCMIVKNEEAKIRNCIDKLKNIADEIIIGVDRTTTDFTIDTIVKMIMEEGVNIKYFTIKSPIEIGFDAARNLTVERASMDWILWIDGDETIEMDYNLKKYLKKNLYDGYSVPQHHYAVEPAALYKTDYPVRIFRNRRGVKFFGMVHEHPETSLNEGVGNIKVLQDVHIMHIGYATEKIRRERFKRNWPLMQRDHEKYPERTLGRFLYVRDLAHLNKYEYEKKRVVSKSIIEKAITIRNTFLEFIKEENIRNVINALEYYSESSMFLTKGFGIVTKIDIEYLSKANKDKSSQTTIESMFADKSDLKALLNLIIDQKLLVYESKYF